MLPDTQAPAAQTVPSVTVSSQRVDDSQAPALVTIVTFKSPSYGVWAIAGAAARPAAERAEARNIVGMRLWRMNQIPDLCDDAVFRDNVFKVCCAAATRKVPNKSNL